MARAAAFFDLEKTLSPHAVEQEVADASAHQVGVEAACAEALDRPDRVRIESVQVQAGWADVLGVYGIWPVRVVRKLGSPRWPGPWWGG